MGFGTQKICCFNCFNVKVCPFQWVLCWILFFPPAELRSQPRQLKPCAWAKMSLTCHGGRTALDKHGPSFEKKGLAWDVKLSVFDYVTADGDHIPITYIKPSDYIRFLMTHHPSALVGGLQSETESSELFDIVDLVEPPFSAGSTQPSPQNI